MPVLPEREPITDHVVREPRRQVSAQRLRRACHRYIKASDARSPAVDVIATLPLDAAATAGYRWTRPQGRIATA